MHFRPVCRKLIQFLLFGATLVFFQNCADSNKINPADLTRAVLGSSAPQVSPPAQSGPTIGSTNIVVNGSSRNWSDGSFAASCAEYFNAPPGRSYSGATGNGTYTISIQGASYPVLCDMTDNGGGWTMCSNWSQTTTQYSAIPTNSIAGNMDFCSTLTGFATTNKLVLYNNMTVIGLYTPTTPIAGVQNQWVVSGGGTSPLYYSVTGDSACAEHEVWEANAPSVAMFGTVVFDHGTNINNGDNYVLTGVDVPSTCYPGGVQLYEGGWNSLRNYSDQLSWQVYSQ